MLCVLHASIRVFSSDPKRKMRVFSFFSYPFSESLPISSRRSLTQRYSHTTAGIFSSFLQILHHASLFPLAASSVFCTLQPQPCRLYIKSTKHDPLFYCSSTILILEFMENLAHIEKNESNNNFSMIRILIR